MKRLLTATTLAMLCVAATAQNLTYADYMQRVLTNNIALTAQRLNIEISAAETQASKVRNDATLAVTYSSNEDWSKKLGDAIEGELSRTFTFGVRSSRIALAQSKSEETAALLEEYLRNFRADATIAFLEQIKATLKLRTAEQREKNLAQVAANDSLRYEHGEISEADLLESRTAAGLARNSRIAAEATAKSCAIALGYYMGNLEGAANLSAGGTLQTDEELAPLDHYTQRATTHRADLRAALNRINTAEAAKKFNAAQRRTDINVKIAAEYNRGAHNEEPSEPSFTTVKAGVAIPLKFSNLNRGARTADRLLVQQAQREADDARLLVQSEVMQAYNEYKYAILQTETFTAGAVENMNKVVEMKREAYEKGEIPFLDYISVENRSRDIEDEYIEALFNKAVKWVELQRAVGCKLDIQ